MRLVVLQVGFIGTFDSKHTKVHLAIRHRLIMISPLQWISEQGVTTVLED